MRRGVKETMCEEQKAMLTKYGWENCFLTVVFSVGLCLSFSHIFWEAKYFSGILLLLFSIFGLYYADSVGLIGSIFRGQKQHVDDSRS